MAKDFLNNKEANKADAARKEREQSNQNLEKSLTNQLDSLSTIDRLLNKALKTEGQREAVLENSLELQQDLTKEQHEKAMLDQQSLEASVEMANGVRDQVKGMMSLVTGARTFVAVLLTNPFVALAAAALVLIKALYEGFIAARDLRKELGGSLATSADFALKMKLVEGSLLLQKFSSEGVKENFDAIRKNLGGVNQASTGFLINFSKITQMTGASGENLATILSIQESVSDASRETLLAQMEANSLMIEMKGIAPEAVFNDLAENAEFFATNMKAGTKNVMNTAIQARKLGLNLSTVTKISESLLDFESSIEKQMEASMLLGRQLNLDKARQLAFMGKHTEMMDEVLKQVGGEAEFTKMLPIARQKLAESVGVDVGELARLAREKQTGVAEAKVKGPVEKTLDVATKSMNYLFDIREDQKAGNQYGKKTAIAVED